MERERQRKVGKMREERGWESSKKEEDVTAIGLLQRSGGLGSVPESSESDESEDDEVLVSEGEELENFDESAFGRLMASAVEQSRCVSQVPGGVPGLTICWETSTVLKFNPRKTPSTKAQAATT